MAQNLPNDMMERFLAATDLVRQTRESERLATAAREKAESDFKFLVLEAGRLATEDDEEEEEPEEEEEEDHAAGATGPTMRERTFAFLNANAGRLFTASEIAPRIGITNLDSLRTTLSQLFADGEIVRGEVKGQYGSKATPLKKEGAAVTTT